MTFFGSEWVKANFQVALPVADFVAELLAALHQQLH